MQSICGGELAKLLEKAAGQRQQRDEGADGKEEDGAAAGRAAEDSARRRSETQATSHFGGERLTLHVGDLQALRAVLLRAAASGGMQQVEAADLARLLQLMDAQVRAGSDKVVSSYDDDEVRHSAAMAADSEARAARASMGSVGRRNSGAAL